MRLSIRIGAQVVDGLGLGLDHNGPRRPRKRGNGMALPNIGERMRTRYGDQAALILTPQTAGTQVSLSIPYQTSS